MAGKTEKKTCFVVSPIGSAGSAERIHADWLLEGIIHPVFGAHYPDYSVIRADKMPAPGMIDSQIIEHLLDAELVIADITTLNPNVFYEIGIRHVMRKPIVHMNLEGEPIPFDIKIFKHIGYSVRTPQALEDAKTNLKSVLDSVFEDGFKVDNPVTRTRSKVEFSEHATPTEKLIQSQIDELSARVAQQEKDRKNTISGGLLLQGSKHAYPPAPAYPTFSDPRMFIKVTGPNGITFETLYDKIENEIQRFFGKRALSTITGDGENIEFTVPISGSSIDSFGEFEGEIRRRGFDVAHWIGG